MALGLRPDQEPEGLAYLAPATLDELVERARALGRAGRFIAGGQTLLPEMLVTPITSGCLIDVGRVADLRRIELADGHVSLGATVTFTEILNGPVAERLPGLAAALRYVGTRTIRNRATVGGSLGWTSPRAELLPALMVHDAVIRTDRRTIRPADFSAGSFRSILEPGELVVGVDIFGPFGGRAAFHELLDRATAGRAIVGVAVAVHGGEVRAAVSGVADRPVLGRWPDSAPPGFEDWLDAAVEAEGVLEDHFHGADYRREMATVLFGRALEEALQ